MCVRLASFPGPPSYVCMISLFPRLPLLCEHVTRRERKHAVDLHSCCVSVGKGLKVKGSSNGSAVVGGVMRETDGRGEDGLMTGLCEEEMKQITHNIGNYFRYVPAQWTYSRIVSRPGCTNKR